MTEVEEFKVGLKTKIFNYNLDQAISNHETKTGLRRQDIYRELKVSAITMSHYMRFLSFPKEERQLQFAIYFGVPVDSLFPEYISEIRIQQPEAVGVTREEAELAGLIPPHIGELEDGIQQEDVQDAIRSALAKLRPRESQVLKWSYGLEEEAPWSLDKIAAEYGVTKTRIGQIRDNALRRLRHPTRSVPLRLAVDRKQEDTIPLPGYLLT